MIANERINNLKEKAHQACIEYVKKKAKKEIDKLKTKKASEK